jgi:hypothetical protein
MSHDNIPQPRPRLGDEAAAQMLDFLYDLVANFESAYAGQILRHRQAEAQRQRDRRQLTLFNDPNGDPF